MQRIGELEKFIPKSKKTKSPNINKEIYIATNEVRRIIAESEQIINAEPLDLEAYPKTVTFVSMILINDLMVKFQIKISQALNAGDFKRNPAFAELFGHIKNITQRCIFLA